MYKWNEIQRENITISPNQLRNIGYYVGTFLVVQTWYLMRYVEFIFILKRNIIENGYVITGMNINTTQEVYFFSLFS